MDFLKPLDRLPNGATVIAIKPCSRYDNSESKAAVVLAVWRQPAEYVTWICAADGSGTTWGHYFDDDIAAAAADFAARVAAATPRETLAGAPR